MKTPALKNAFLEELTTLVEAAPFDLVCVVIHKARHQAQYRTPATPITWRSALASSECAACWFSVAPGKKAGRSG